MLPGRRRIRIRTRNAERGTRNESRASLFRVPPSAIPLAFLAACSPVSTRPAFAPFPEAPAVVLDAPPLRVFGEVQSWLTDAGLRLDRASVEDRFVETAWYDTRAKRSESGRGEGLDPRSTVKIRCWIDPDAPGKSKLTVEAVVRPLLDPSRTERDLEVIAPADHEGRKLVDRLVEAVKKKLGTT
jgi:hypothetical protein